MAEEKLLCYNLGCPTKEFKASENTDTSCTFHPGQPFFHDAYKGWSCCNRKSVVFTDFLSIKGCATGRHSNVKPPEPEKAVEEIIEDIVETKVAQPKVEPLKRPSSDTPRVKLKSELSQSLKTQTYSNPVVKKADEENNTETPIGKACVNNGCSAKYEGTASDNEICKYHTGVPIFHEGLKFWSCCKKRTTEFQAFLEQKGCSDGSHVWVKPKDDNEDSEGKRLIKCRYDWHQTGSDVIVAIYGKKFDPNLSFVEVNPVKLNVELYFPEEVAYYKEEWILAGIILPDKCSSLMTPTKIEVKLKKAEPISWQNLELPMEKMKSIEKTEEQQIKNVGVDPVDLDDL